ncbi:hypothetical protein, partial [Bacillus cereus]|uniref:hypothetical protein n=1 Tax=Bacillus cereus TaxID=1396 RepID=UPI001C12C884
VHLPPTRWTTSFTLLEEGVFLAKLINLSFRGNSSKKKDAFLEESILLLLGIASGKCGFTTVRGTAPHPST